MALIWIGEGHGYKPDGTYDSGARDPDIRITEQEIAETIIPHFVERARNLGHRVIAETGPDDPNWRGSVENIKAMPTKPNVAIEIHADWHKNEHPGGFALWPEGSLAGEELGESLAQYWENYGLAFNVGLHGPRSNLGFLNGLRKYTLPILWEVAPIDRIPGDRIAAGRALADGVNEFLNDVEPEPSFGSAQWPVDMDRYRLDRIVREYHNPGNRIDVADVIAALYNAAP